MPIDTKTEIENAYTSGSHALHERRDAIYLVGRRSVSLSSLFSDACKRLEIATERAMGCERIGNTLRLHVSKDKRVDFELVNDEEAGRLLVGDIIAEDSVD